MDRLDRKYTILLEKRFISGEIFEFGGEFQLRIAHNKAYDVFSFVTCMAKEEESFAVLKHQTANI